MNKKEKHEKYSHPIQTFLNDRQFALFKKEMRRKKMTRAELVRDMIDREMGGL